VNIPDLIGDSVSKADQPARPTLEQIIVADQGSPMR
jgi:hypothetical protein